MKSRSLHYVLGFLSFVVAVGLACSAVAGSPTAVPPTPTPQPPSPTQEPAAATQAPAATTAADTTPSGDSSLVTFTDQNKYFQIDLPGDWTHTTSSGDHDYWDTFTSPDKAAVVESYVYDDGTPWSGKDSGKAALYILNKLYSKTGSEGDIRVTEEKRQQDGSDRLTWTSKAGKYSGISFFEIRNGTTFLMFTVDWGNDSKDQYIDTLNNVIASYRIP
jgi:hypothetical protein